MNVLVTNDDGAQAPVLQALRQALAPLGRVVVVAPDRDQSATSHALTLQRPFRIQRHEPDLYSVDGTPTDCVLIAFHGMLVEKPDFVVSGVNHGPNMGEDVYYSGTVAAALEGVLQGVPAIAASLATRQPTDFADPAASIGRLMRQVLEHGVPPRMLLNVNFPHRPAAELRGVQLTRLGTRVYHDTLVKKVDPRGKDYYWIGGEDPLWEPEPGTDFHAVHHGMVSVTPMRLDRTDAEAIGRLEGWALRP
jgi:5'-nucleotidase